MRSAFTNKFGHLIVKNDVTMATFRGTNARVREKVQTIHYKSEVGALYSINELH